MKLRELSSFFRIRSSSAFIGLACRGVSLVPADKIEDTLILIFRAFQLLNGALPDEKEFDEIIFTISRKQSLLDAEKLVSSARAKSMDGASAVKAADSLAGLTLESKLQFASLLLEMDKSYLPVKPEVCQCFREMAQHLGLNDKRIDELLENDERRRNTAAKVLNSGAGLLVAFVVIVLFLLVATFIRALFFGILLAYLLLPVEKFFENRFFRSPRVKAISGFLSSLNPFRRFPSLIGKTNHQTVQEKHASMKNSLVMKSVAATMISAVVFLLIALLLLTGLIIPAAFKVSKDLKNSISSNHYVILFENRLNELTNRTTLPASAAKIQKKDPDPARQPEKNAAEEQISLKEYLKKIRPQLKAYVFQYRQQLTKFAFDQGKDIVSVVFSIASYIGKFFVDILLMLFFFLYFLQKMAKFTDSFNGYDRKSETLGTWAVKSIFGTGWLPAVSPASQKEAASIIDRICLMLKCWAKGYITIILIELPLYLILFTLIGVPYGIFLAMISCTTILLPVLGLSICIILTCSVCIIFCETHLVATLIGVLLVYGIVNGVMEQLIMFPHFIGGSIGLTILETIIVVLLGGLFAGIPGMIFAVPAAAVIKFLVPKIYEVWHSRESKKSS